MTRFSGTNLLCVRAERTVFREVGFVLQDHEALIITGSNGSGKTSLLRLMAAISVPYSGTLLWNDSVFSTNAITLERHRSRLHYLGHRDGIKSSETPFEILSFWAKIAHQKCVSERVSEVLHRLEMSSLMDIPCRYLSEGQRRRVSLGRFLLSEVPLWLFDEPLAVLDQRGRFLLKTSIEEHLSLGGIVALTTHIPFFLKGAKHLNLDDFSPLLRQQKDSFIEWYF